MKNVADQRYLSIKSTPDGSYTIYNSELNENYHSEFGAQTESNYVYIKQGLSIIQKKVIHVFEMGFGTGLNAYLAWTYAQEYNKIVHFISIEKFPVSVDFLPVPSFIDNRMDSVTAWNNIQQAAWNSTRNVDNSFILTKLNVDIADFEHYSTYDIIFYDAFAPSVQPELWTPVIFKALHSRLNPEGILVTYSSAGIVKRALISAGFTLQRLPGPPGKKHMLRAIKNR